MLWLYGMGVSQLTADFTGLNRNLCTEKETLLQKQQQKQKQKKNEH